MQRTLLLIAIGLVLAIPGGAGAVDSPPPPKLIRLKIHSIVGLGRSQAPQTFEILLECDSDKFYEGRLELKWYLGKTLVHEFLSQEMAVNAAGQRLRLTLPPIIMYSDKTNVNAYGRFLTERGIIDLGEVTSDLPAMTKRTLVVAEVTPLELQRLEYTRCIADSLGLERFNPHSDAHSDLLTYTARLAPEEMPALAAGLTGFDVIALEGEGFRRLSRGQLTAVAEWIAGGGSVVVAPPRDNLTAAHVAFLNRIIGRPISGGGDPGELRRVFTTDEQGRLLAPEELSSSGKKLARHFFGLGRAVVVHEPLDSQVDFATGEWKETVAFLWKVRAAQRRMIQQTGSWDLPGLGPHVVGAPSVFSWQRDDLALAIRQLLMPERLEGVPFSVVVVILSLYLLAVAPGDYFLLGRLNCRKYTWWLFVLISATFTLFTVMIAEFYMGHADYRTSLIFVDMAQRTVAGDTSANPARTSRFEMMFVATQRTLERDLRNCLYADVTGSEKIQELRLSTDRPFGLSDADEFDLNSQYDSDLPVYEGSMPASFIVRQRLRQWSPRITRETAFGADPVRLAETAIDWNGLPVASLDSADGRRALFTKINAAEPSAEVLLLNGRWAYSQVHNGSPPDSVETKGTNITVLVSRGGPWVPKVLNVPASSESSPAGQSASPAAALAIRASVRPATGLFAICSQISPTGGQILEDLALLDDDDQREWLLIVVVRRENSSIVFRRLLHQTASPEGP